MTFRSILAWCGAVSGSLLALGCKTAPRPSVASIVCRLALEAIPPEARNRACHPCRVTVWAAECLCTFDLTVPRGAYLAGLKQSMRGYREILTGHDRSVIAVYSDGEHKSVDMKFSPMKAGWNHVDLVFTVLPD